MLTEAEIKRLELRDDKYMVCDFDCLYLLVRPTGKKTWVYRPRNKNASKKTLGYWPRMSLKEARRARDDLAEQAITGATPTLTFRELAADWLKRKALPSLKPRTIHQITYRLDAFLLPAFGDMVTDDITAPMLLKLCQSIEARGTYETAHRVQNLFGQIARYGIPKGRCTRDISRDLIDALAKVPTGHMASIHVPAQLGELLRAIDKVSSERVRRLILFQAYTFVRPSEARCALWSEFDLSRAEWRIPPERMKMKQPHIIPLSCQAVDLLHEVERPEGLVFPSARGELPMSDMTLSMSLRRACEAAGLPRMVPHGWRSAASTTLNELGWAPDAVERQLAHIPKGVRGVYNFAQYLDTRRNMMQAWADWLDGLRDSTNVTNYR